MVIHLGTALENHTLSQLVKDTRNMMQPHTAIRLRERKSNKVKDFVVMAGPLGITYLMVFSQNEKTGSTHLRMSSMPRGPTISFKILEYSLCKDIARIQRHPKSISASSPIFLNPPLLVLNGFTNPKDSSPEEKLVVTMFQNMYPPISPMNTKVGTIKRVLLLNKDKETGVIELRHYVIETKLVDVSRNVKKLINIKSHLNKKLPNLSKTKDVADIILDPYAQAGFTSDSEVEDDSIVEVKEDDDAVLTKPVVAQATEGGEDEDDDVSVQPSATKRKKAVKLTEIGPRMKLQLVKIEDGVCGGKVLYHNQFTKTKSEMNKLEQKHAVRRKERELRKKQQAANVAKKNEKKVLKKQRREERKKAGEDVGDSSDDSGDDAPESGAEMEDYSDMDVDESDSASDAGDDDKLFDEDE